MRSAAALALEGLTISASLLPADAEDRPIDHCHVIADAGLLPFGGPGAAVSVVMWRL